MVIATGHVKALAVLDHPRKAFLIKNHNLIHKIKIIGGLPCYQFFFSCFT